MKLLRSQPVDFTKGSVMQGVIRFTIPVFFANIFSSLYSIVDATVCGQFVGAHALGAVNASFALTTVLVALCAGLGIGTSVVLSQLYGSGRLDEVRQAVGTALTTACSLCIVISILGLIFARNLLTLLNTPADLLNNAVLYLRIVMIGFLGQLLSGMGSGLLRGLGDSSYPAFCLLVSSVLNIVLDVVFVALFHWGVAGVAWATVIAHYLSAAMAILRLFSGRYGFRMTPDAFRIRGYYLKMIVRIGLFGALNMLVTSLGMMLIQRFANRFGADFVSANGVVQKVDSFAMLPMSTIGGTISTFCAQVFGAGQLDRAKEGALKCTLAALAISALVAVVIFFAAPLLLLIFINKADPSYAAVSTMGVASLRVLAFFYIAYALEQCLYCIMQGAGALRPAVILTAVGMVLRVLLVYLLAVRGDSYLGLFWATNLFYLLLSAFYALYLKFGRTLSYVVTKKE